MDLEEFLAKFPKFSDTPLGRKLAEMQRRAREHFAKAQRAHEHMLEAKADFTFEDTELKALERAAQDRSLTRVTHERGGTFIDTDHPRLEAARAARERAKATYKEARTHYESLSKSRCGDAAVLGRVIGYLNANASVRKAAYAHYGVEQ